MDYVRLMEFLGYSDKAFEITEYFEFLVTASGVLCSEEMCPDTSNISLRIAFLIALGDYESVEDYDEFNVVEYMRELQSDI